MKLNPLEVSDYPRLLPFFQNQRHPLCVYSLSSLLAWSNDWVQPYGAEIGESLILAAKFSEETENDHLILPVSPERDHSPEELREIARKTGFSAYWFIPETYVEAFGEERISRHFVVSEQPEYHDYVYGAEDLARLKGNRYSKKRNLIRQFERAYLNGQGDRIVVQKITSRDVPECLEFLEQWCQAHDCDAENHLELACEKAAIQNTLLNLALLEVNGILARIDGRVKAFGIASVLTDGMGVLHYEKAQAEVKGLYQYFDRACAQRLFEGVRFINKESDMGLPGLEKAKKSYHPVRIVKSFRLDLRT